MPHAQQLALRVADILPIGIAPFERAQYPTSIKPVVNGTRTVARLAFTNRLQELHLPSVPMTGLSVPTGRVRRYGSGTRKSGVVANDQQAQPTPRRHPSAGNIGMDEPAPAPTASGAASSSRTTDYPAGFDRSTERIELGPGLDPDLIGRLIGRVSGRRVLELGCGDGSNAVAMALAGAKVISVDTSPERLSIARQLAEEHDVRVEFHHSDLADLAFIRADQIDLSLVIYSLIEIEDVARVFRQVNRVLRTDASIVVSLPHPIEWATGVENGSVVIERSLFDRSPVGSGSGAPRIPHSISDVFVALSRSNFRVDHLMEPQINLEMTADVARHELHPASVIFRGRKQGS